MGWSQSWNVVCELNINVVMDCYMYKTRNESGSQVETHHHNEHVLIKIEYADIQNQGRINNAI